MKTPKKTSLVIVALALLACLVWLVWLVSRPDEPGGASASETSRSPSFEVHVEKPRIDRFLGGILPAKVEAKLFGGGELRFDHLSRGAHVGTYLRSLNGGGNPTWGKLLSRTRRSSSISRTRSSYSAMRL